MLTELVLHNFGIYRGRHVVALAPPSPDRPVVLIGGLNGAGKTTFLDGLQLALYGHRARTSNRRETGYEEYLRRCINRSVASDDGAALELSFEVDRDGATVTYRLARQWSERGGRVRESLGVWVDGVRDDVLAENWSDHVEEIIPLEISSLFFFDGEKIEALADPSRARAVIRSAVTSLLGIGVVDRLSNDLVALQRRQRAPERDEDLERRIANAAVALETARAARLQAHDRLGHERVLLGKAKLELVRTEEAYASGGGTLLEQRKELEAQHAVASARVASTEEALRHEAAGSLPLALVTEQLRDLRVSAEAQQRHAEAMLLLQLLEQRDSQVLQALVGSVDARAVNELRQAFERDRLMRSAVDEPAEVVLVSSEGRADLTRALDNLPVTCERAQSLLQELAAAQDALVAYERKLSAVPAAEAVATLARKREDARTRVLEAQGRCSFIEEETERLTSARSDAKLQWERAVAQQIERALKSEDTARLIEHTERAKRTLATYRERLLERQIHKLEVAVLDSFRKLMRKQGLVADLRINGNDFDLTLIGSDGEVLRAERLSAGERQLLAVAILWGLARLAGHRLPTVVDTPLGRLDSTHRRHLVERYFPQAGRQVLLLSTDEEIDESLQSLLAQSVGHDYLIRYDDDSKSSVIEAGYFWGAGQDAA